MKPPRLGFGSWMLKRVKPSKTSRKGNDSTSLWGPVRSQQPKLRSVRERHGSLIRDYHKLATCKGLILTGVGSPHTQGTFFSRPESKPWPFSTEPYKLESLHNFGPDFEPYQQKEKTIGAKMKGSYFQPWKYTSSIFL